MILRLEGIVPAYNDGRIVGEIASGMGEKSLRDLRRIVGKVGKLNIVFSMLWDKVKLFLGGKKNPP